MAVPGAASIQRLDTSVYCVPTDRPEADGTFAWTSTTLVLVEAVADSGARGLGFSYCSAAAAEVIHGALTSAVAGSSVDDVRATWLRMLAAVRNIGRQGVAANAISAVDIALWDLKARLAEVSLANLLGAARGAVPIYGSGGFTSYSDAELADQLGTWVRQGIPRVKMKIGTDWGAQPETDVHRVAVARQAIGPEADLFVDANGAYSARQAIALAERFSHYGVSYFEEPVSSDHLDQLRQVRDRAPMAIAAGEYGYDPWYFQAMLRAGAVDVLQADVTRCLGVTGWLKAAELAWAAGVEFSAHTAPSIHAQLGCVAPAIAHVEYFHDHARIEQLFFDGAPRPVGGTLQPEPGRWGLGLELKRQDAERWRIA
jgi:L-alanine-DL-glutamate epimerase-like enolase superfamily enzyme